MLTNWKTVSQSIKTLKKIEERLASDEIDYNKKEKLVLQRQKLKLEQALGGIKNMGGYPDLVFIIDTFKESLAIAEAKKLGVPIMAILDSNCNPDGITFPIPGNDDSAKAIKLYCRLLSDAAIAGVKENMAISGVDLSKFETGEEIAQYKNSITKPEKREEKDSRDFKGKKDFKGRKDAHSHKPAAKSEETSEKKRVAHSDDKKPVSKKPVAKKPVEKPAAAKKPAAKK
jgi:ribosomal protein S2